MENPIKMDDLGYHYFRKHPYWSSTYFPSLDWKADPQESPVELVASPGLNLNEVKESSVGTGVQTKQETPTVVSNGSFFCG